jgi:hypothetical protein
MTLETSSGTIYGLYTDLNLSLGTVPEGLFPYPLAWDEGGDDSIPTSIERAHAVCSFGILVVNSPLDFGGADNIRIDDWGFDEEDDKNCPEWIKQHLPDE